MTDFHAAHSMDATWFAVDRDGHIAQFETGEDGAYPKAAEVVGDPWPLIAALEAMADGEPSRLDPNGYAPPGLDRCGMRHHRPGGYIPRVIFLRDLAPMAREIEADRALAVPAVEGFAVIVPTLTERLYDELEATGAVTYVDYWSDDDATPPSCGIFRYEHHSECSYAGPFGRRRVPIHPVHVDQLPPAVRKLAQAVVFHDLRFRDASMIQPFGRVPCTAWGDAWLSQDGVLRPVPGREDEFRDTIQDLDDPLVRSVELP